MKKLKLVKISEPRLASIKCDVCGETYAVPKKRGISDDAIKIQNFVSLNYFCCYGSIIGDGDLVELDMCEDCFVDILGKYIKVNGNNFVPSERSSKDNEKS